MSGHKSPSPLPEMGVVDSAKRCVSVFVLNPETAVVLCFVLFGCSTANYNIILKPVDSSSWPSGSIKLAT